ncbi:aspartyl protease family protein [Swaminathania salitolerans]|uniref:Peptidase A2 domain-containing protein n=1 Tax=Swaminathania salitolerans TaxID=182838 RepID=A0A511BR62_9PROT|nr:aspartyl protease family protein [Swaminathania salitolerans]GBQ12324.1 hypothetical protein AA21291_1150 [Swaminathania salitolerans LMG 21291]GEL02809.1 hypothetical protein SSA02_19720 [Swaminathania salitolerans]
MPRPVPLALASFCLGVLLHGTVAHASPCTPPVHVADLPLHNDALFLNAPVVLDGRQARFILDTGSEGSLITPEAAGALHLTPDPDHATVIQGPNGRGQLAPNMRVQALALGPVPMGSRAIPLGGLPGVPSLTPPIAGLMGVDLLHRYDVEFDVPHGRLRLWKPAPPGDRCTASPAWPAGYTALATRREGTRLTVAFTLDGHDGVALLDSGARSHILARRFANAMGITDAVLARDPGGVTSGVDLNARWYHWHEFHALHLRTSKAGPDTGTGNPVWKDPVLTVSDLRDSADMLLGADWFAQHDIWVSFSAGQIWVR